MAKLPRWIVYGALGVIAVGAVIYSGPEKGKSRITVKRDTVNKSKRLADVFTQEDYFPPAFEPVNDSHRNAFMPIVAKRSSGIAAVLTPDAVPSELAGGDPNWVYTGTAILDGVPAALLENKVTFEGEFVRQGQTWNRAKIHQITPETLTLAGASGRHWTLRLIDEEYDLENWTEEGMRPVSPQLNGPIGRGVTVRPESRQTVTAQARTEGKQNAN